MTDPSESAVPSAVACGDALDAARAMLRHALHAGESGGLICARYSNAIADVVRTLVSPALPEGSRRFGRIALVAIGGLGRGELGPHSDVDLVVLTEQLPAEGDTAFEDWARNLVHPMWDVGLRPNVTVQDVASWLDGSVDDLSLCTSLLDIRKIAGDGELVGELVERGRQRFFRGQRSAFIHRLADDVKERHLRFGSTVHRVEPDLKFGPGGLRDWAIVAWCLSATYETFDLVTLARDEVLRPRIATILGLARDELLRLRAALHCVAKRPQDRLAFQYQELLPTTLGMVADGAVPDSELVGAIESMMQRYYQAARDLLRYGRRVCEQCLPPRLQPAREQRVDERFYVSDHRLRHYGSDPFADTPVLALDALAIARDHEIELSGVTFDCIAEAAGGEAAAGLCHEPEAIRRFLDILIVADSGRPSALELCNELGLLERIVPEFGPSRGRMQHEGLHAYTVDQHTLNAVGFLKAIERGDFRKDYPLATALHLDVEDPRVLYLATLLHDVGKALGGDQCETGAKVARSVARRMGFSEADSERCAQLVYEHVTMPMLSQKRDLGDPLLIAEFAERIGDHRTLRELYLLTLADMSQVHPGFLSSWKLTLHDELYLLTSAFLRRGKARAGVVRVDGGEPLGLPDRYYALYDLAMRRHHALLIDRLLAERRAVVLDLVQASGSLRLTVVARDRPGLLAQAAGMLDDCGLEVMAADVFSVPGERPVALDVFRIVPRDSDRGPPDSVMLGAMEQSMEHGWDAEELGAVPPPLPRPRWTGPRRVTTEVVFASDPAGQRTIVEIHTLDQPGVLRRITSAFASLGLDIQLARCLSEGGRVSDVFYVERCSDEQREVLRARLSQYLRRN